MNRSIAEQRQERAFKIAQIAATLTTQPDAAAVERAAEILKLSEELVAKQCGEFR